jgi:hypothetical protein
MMIGSGLLGLFVTIVVLIIVYFLIKYLIDKAPTDNPNSTKAKQIIGYVWLALCVLWLCYILLSVAGITGPIQHVGRL